MSAVLLVDETPSAPVSAYPNAYVPVVPNGKTCAVTGLGHAKLYQLLLRGSAARHVRTVSLKEPGTLRGKLLFHAGDMLRWLDNQAAAQAKKRMVAAVSEKEPEGELCHAS